MVEGPQCHLKARKLEGAGLVGQRVLRAVCPGNATLAARLASAGPILRIVAVGKECFFVFADCALRLHFAMSGSQVKVKTLQQQEAERLAEWKPVRDMRCCFSASTTAVTRVAAVANMSLAADGPEGLRPAGKAAWSRTARSGQCGARPARAVLRSQWTVGAVCYGS